jgi:hypothetical protein
MRVSWVVEIGDEFAPEFDALHEDVQTEILARRGGNHAGERK